LHNKGDNLWGSSDIWCLRLLHDEKIHGSQELLEIQDQNVSGIDEGIESLETKTSMNLLKINWTING
tara:strand:+ start:316 stop:516 length:201 start_codon:yes stop_codon:yes gene_type:complete